LHTGSRQIRQSPPHPAPGSPASGRCWMG
jgi:hypothetical protein